MTSKVICDLADWVLWLFMILITENLAQPWDLTLKRGQQALNLALVISPS